MKIFRSLLLILCLAPIWVSGQISIDLNQLEYADCHTASDPDTAFYLGKVLYLKSKKQNKPHLQGLSALVLGKTMFHQGSFKQATEYLIEASGLLQELDDEAKLAESYIWLGTVYQYAKQYPLSLNYFLRAQSLYLESNDQYGLADTYGWIGHYYEKLGSSDSALYFQRKALALHHRLEHQEGLAVVYDNLGSLHEDLANYDSAYLYFEKAYKVNASLKRISNLIINLNNIGDIYRKTDQLLKAIQITDSTLALAKRHHLKYQIRSAYKDLSKIYLRQRDYYRAYHYLDSAMLLSTEILNHESARRITRLQSIYETERKEQQISLLQAEQQANSKLRLVLVLTLIMVVAAALAVVYFLRSKLLNNKKILEQTERLVKAEQDLLVADLKNSLLNEQNLKNELHNRGLIESQLRNELALKSQTLATHTISLIRKNNFMDELREELKRIKKLDRSGVQKGINKLLTSISLNCAQEEDWEEFQKVFEEIHIDFFNNLKKKFPDLTPTELRLSALLKLNLSSKDIATILGISQDSLRVSRYRLRKKLQLESGVDISHYLIDH